MTARFAWSVVVVTAVLALLDTVLAVQGRHLEDFSWVVHGWPIITLTGVLSAVMGALVLTRQPRQPIGWLLLIPGLTTCVSLAADAYNKWVLLEGGPGGATSALVAGWVASFFGAQVPLAANALIVLLAPGGALISRGWRVPAAVAVAGCLAWSAPPLLEAAEYASPDPHVAGLSLELAITGVILVVVGLLAGVVSLWVRHRRSSGLERVQIRWFLAVALPQAVAMVWLLVVRQVIRSDSDALAQLPLIVTELVFPLGIAVAVLRYRLYDLGLVVNRAWILLGATAFDGVAYILVVAAAGGALGGFWPSVLASALVACAFQPVRSSVLGLADRLAYGRRTAPYEALADLSRRLGEGLTADTTLSTIAAACLDATAASAVELDLRDEHGRVVGRASAGLPDAGAKVEAFGIVEGHEVLGTLLVSARRGRPLRRRDRTLLAGVGEQAGMAFRSLRLDAVLAGRVTALGEITSALEDSRRRLERTRIDELHRLDGTLSATVTPPLQHVGRLLDALSHDLPGGTDPRWDEVSAAVGRTLALLREISHGTHSDLLETAGLVPAIEAHLRHRGDTTALQVTAGFRAVRFDPGVETAVHRCVVAALAGPVRSIALSATETELTASIVVGAGLPTGSGALSDQLVDVDGTVVSTRWDDLGGWTVRVPIASPAAAAVPAPIGR